MGAGQSKTEVMFDRYPADNEVVKDIKLSPAMINQLTAPPPVQLEQQQAPLPEVDVEQIKVNFELLRTSKFNTNSKVSNRKRTATSNRG